MPGAQERPPACIPGTPTIPGGRGAMQRLPAASLEDARARRGAAAPKWPATPRRSEAKPRDIYAVIAYFLAHTSQADDYLRIRERRVAEVRQANERRFDPAGISARLMARRRGGFRVIRLLGDENLEDLGRVVWG